MKCPQVANHCALLSLDLPLDLSFSSHIHCSVVCGTAPFCERSKWICYSFCSEVSWILSILAIILLRKTSCLTRNLHLSVICIAFTDILSDHLIIICRT